MVPPHYAAAPMGSRRKSKPPDDRGTHVRHLLAVDAANVIHRLVARQQEMVALFSRRRDRTPMTEAVRSWFPSITFAELSLLPPPEQKAVSLFYELLDEVQKALTGMLEPEMVETSLGHAEVRAIFTANKTTIAGCMVMDGVVRRNAQVRLLRGGEPVHEGTIETLRRVKDDVREVNAGFECGIVLGGRNDVQVGDVIACFVVEAKPR